MTVVSANRNPERAELLDLLLEHGILHRSETQPVLSRDGTSARWMLDSLPVTLSPRGAKLAGQLLLQRLSGFEGRQLATFGLTAVPIMQSAILQSDRGHFGLLVRRERKPHGSQKLIEGQVDPDEPVIMIEDSIASGTNVSQGIAALESAGLRVEGCVALVRFGWEGGFSDLRGRGYHLETVYDIFEDFMTRMEGEQGANCNPTKSFGELPWSRHYAPERLHPAHLARAVLNEYCRSGELLRPPLRLDRDDYDSSGGAWVSLRSRDDIFDRRAREGFWHFPVERSWGVCEDVVRAAFLAGCALPKGAERLGMIESSHVAVSFFSALERVTVAELDNDRYGIVVASGERPEIMGGALPRMPGIRDEWQQFRHARYKNAGLYEFEPYVIYRHEVSKFVEPGAPWQPSGVARTDDAPDCGPLAVWARNLGRGREPLQPLTIPAMPASAEQIFVTIYIDGDVRGCAGSEITSLEENLRELLKVALADERFEDIPIEKDSAVAVSVSVLYNHLEMGDFSREEVRFRYCNGQQVLSVEQNSRHGLLLPFVATWMSLDAEDFVDEVIDKAGITRGPYNWRRFDCTTWLADEDGNWKLEGGFKRSAVTLTIDEVARLHSDYLERNLRADGSLYFSYYPFQNTLYQGIDAARQAHAAWTLARAGHRDTATLALRYALDQADDSPLALSRDAFALLTICESGMPELEDPALLTARLLASFDRHGRVATWQTCPRSAASQMDEDIEGAEDEEQETVDSEELQNYVPGQLLLALAAAARSAFVSLDEPKIEHAFSYYRHRFRYKRDFGQVSWMTLAAAAWFRLMSWRELAELVFEIADWILEFQQAKTGAFLTDHQPDTPGFTTAVYLEAIAAAFHVALKFDPLRCSRYDEAWRRGFTFLDRLIIQERDSSILPNAEYAIGGLRENLFSAHIRIDFVQHSLAAILERFPYILVTLPTHQEDKNGYETQETGSKTDRGSRAAQAEDIPSTDRGSRTAQEEEGTSKADRGSCTSQEEEATSKADCGSGASQKA